MLSKLAAVSILSLSILTAVYSESADRPNIIYILADDLGYGDVSCLNPERGKIQTPRMDQLAKEGMTFTDAHTSSSVCTPTRYSILTGRYNWRTHLQKQVIMGFDPPLINQGRTTVASFLKEQGYNTACIGKWHLGLGLSTTDGGPINLEGITNVDWMAPITGGPVDLGFDSFWGISSSLNIPPYVYIEDDHFVAEDIIMHKTGRKGPKGLHFDDVQTLPLITQKTIDFINQQDADTPFFAYVSLTSPHTPIVPTNEWKGKSSIGDYGDFVMHTDAIIGEIADALDASGLGENTLIIVTSDNGTSKWCGTQKLLEQEHYFSAHFRGSKGDLWDGGHRVPFIVRWPAQVKAGSVSDQLISLNDLIATSAELTNAKLPETAGEDSVSFLPALSGEPIISSRKGVIHHSFSGHFAYRKGKWKLLLAKASGGWTSPTEGEAPEGASRAQLYNMELDPSETNNLYESHPEIAEQLLAQLESEVSRGRSTAGIELKNDVDKIELWKSGQANQ